MVSDPISNFIIQLKNSSAVRKERVVVGYSQLLFSIAEKLQARGFIHAAEKKIRKGKKFLDIELAYRSDGSAALSDVKRISTPGRRMYGKSTEMHNVRAGRGILIVSTPLGILTGDEARTQNVGGEMLFTLW